MIITHTQTHQLFKCRQSPICLAHLEEESEENHLIFANFISSLFSLFVQLTATTKAQLNNKLLLDEILPLYDTSLLSTLLSISLLLLLAWRHLSLFHNIHPSLLFSSLLDSLFNLSARVHPHHTFLGKILMISSSLSLPFLNQSESVLEQETFLI